MTNPVVHVKIPPHLHSAAKMRAKAERRTLASVVVLALEAFLKSAKPS